MRSYTKSLNDLVEQRAQLERDTELLEAVLELDSLNDSARTAFEDMKRIVDAGVPLTPKRREWAHAMSRGERYEPVEEYENAYSAGKVPRGREVTLMVGNRPLRPPGRK